MNRIDAKFASLKEAGHAAFIPFLTAGDPDLDATRRLILAVEKSGADVIELGFPFSDPVADGPVIQASYTRVLDGGQRTEDVFRMVEVLREESEIPVVAMISYSLVFKMGFEAFMRRALKAGVDGATIPDLPVEEAEDFHKLAAENDFRLICFVTPTTTPERLDAVIKHSKGFIYYISVRGTTGARTELPTDLAENLRRLRAAAAVPVAVGFGISDPDQAATVARAADGVIVGSALVRRIHAAVEEEGDPVEAASAFVALMAEATRDA